MKRTTRNRQAALLVSALLLTGCSGTEADPGGGGSGRKRLTTEEKLQQLIDFCNDYPDRPVCKENNLGQ